MDASGAKSQVAGITSAIVVMFVLLFLTPVFKNMPQNVQGAIVIAAVIGLFNYSEWFFLWKVSMPCCACCAVPAALRCICFAGHAASSGGALHPSGCACTTTWLYSSGRPCFFVRQQNTGGRCALALSCLLLLLLLSLASHVQVNKFDWIVFNAAWLGVMFAGVEKGLAIAIGLSVLIVLYKTGFPHLAVLGRLPGTTVYR